MRFSELEKRLRDAGVESSRGEAELIIEELLGKRVSIESEYEDSLLLPVIEKRRGGYPLQYILGKWWFARCEFEVNENCLVPRPDTEAVVEEAVKLLPRHAVFADLCTGSGCIAISLCDLRADVRGVAVELFEKTLELAERNAVRNKVSDRLDLKQGDVLSGSVLGDGKYDAIISNPPYIRSDVVDTLSREVGYEPRAALDGGCDGLLFYRAIIEKYQNNLKSDGYFLFEIGYDQAEDIGNIAAEHLFSCTVKKDLGGNYRVAILKRQ